MNELRDIVRETRLAWSQGLAPVLATVIGVRGSAYRRPGARMLVTEEGWKAGSVSGGCLEADVVRRARWLMEGRRVLVRTYDTSADADGAGASLGCGGEVDVLLEALRAEAAVPLIPLLERVLATRQPLTLRTVVGDADEALLGRREARRGAEVVASDAPQRGGLTWFEETLAPPLRLWLVGAGHDALPLAQMAAVSGWDVHVVDWRQALATRARFPSAVSVGVVAPSGLGAALELDPRTAVILMSHNSEYDRRALEVLLPGRRAGYLGLLGPRHRTRELLEQLREQGVRWSPDDEAHLHAPVGLDLGGDGPGAVATAVLAEAQACLHARDARPLKERTAPLHDVTRDDRDLRSL